MVLLSLPAAAAASWGSLLAPHRVAGEVFVAIMFAAVYLRRLENRRMALALVVF
jgi:hypothetical protein